MIMSAAVDPVLRAWKASAFLERRRIAFCFRDAEVIDRNSPKGDFALAHWDYATVTVGRSSRLRGASRDRLGANAEDLLWKLETPDAVLELPAPSAARARPRSAALN